MISACHSVSVLFTTNAERLGMHGNVATKILSPIFYDGKHADLKLLFEQTMSHIVAQVEARASTAADVNHENFLMKQFINQMRTTMIGRNESDLLEIYDAALMELFAVDTLEEVAAILDCDNGNTAVDMQ